MIVAIEKRTFRAIPSPTRADMARFMAKVDVRGPNHCWLWTGSRSKDGYGRFRIGASLHNAHRVAIVWLGNGVVGGDDYALHACDTPACCNPAHLRVGSQADNARDRESRGRGNHWSGPARSAIAKRCAKYQDAHWSRRKPEALARGERHAATTLSTADVIAIRASRESHAELARRYQMSAMGIAGIRAGRTWKLVGVGAC